MYEPEFIYTQRGKGRPLPPYESEIKRLKDALHGVIDLINAAISDTQQAKSLLDNVTPVLEEKTEAAEEACGDALDATLAAYTATCGMSIVDGMLCVTYESEEQWQ